MFRSGRRPTGRSRAARRREVTVRLLPAQSSSVSVPLTATPLGGAAEADYTGIPASLEFRGERDEQDVHGHGGRRCRRGPRRERAHRLRGVAAGDRGRQPGDGEADRRRQHQRGQYLRYGSHGGELRPGLQRLQQLRMLGRVGGSHLHQHRQPGRGANVHDPGSVGRGRDKRGKPGNRNLWFWVSPDKLFRDYENHRLVLVLDGRRFPFRTSDSAANSRRVKVWEDTGLTWSQGRTVRVEILDLPNAAPNATPNRGHPWFAVADAEANEADGYIDFTVKLRRPTVDGSPLLIGAEVDYTTVDGTAVAGEDYTHTTGTLTFGEDQEKATVRVPLIDDAVEDDGETFTLLLSNPKGATIADGEATGTIRNTEGLTASFENVPESHAGSGEFTLRLAFSEALAAGGAGRKIGQALVLTGATRGTVLRVDGRRDLYEFKVRPSGGGAVTVSLPATTGACDASDAICTAGGDKLSGAVSAEIAGPDTGQEPQDSLTASFEDVPESHDGSSAFTLRVAFSEAVSTGFRTMRDDAFTVTGGSVNRAKRVDGASDLWEIRVEPSGSGAVTVSLPATTGACTATGAVCTSGGRKLSGAVSAEIAGPPETPATTLTAEFANVPSEHDGSSAFEVRVLFSEALAGGGSGRRIAQSLALSGATRGDVRRVDGRRDLYRFQVRPSGNGAVTVSLASTGACGSATAVCTSDGRALSNVPEATIQGPPSIAVQDAEVDEGPNAALAFTVTLSRAASGTVTVDYATSDVTATAGDDYTATSGTLTFAVGETEKAVSVAVLDDAHDDGGETLRLTLSNPSGAWLSDATATGTIRNDDPMLSAWLARFGRTVAEQVVDAVESRIRSAPHPGAEVTLAGQRIDLGPQAGTGAAAEEAREAPAWLADVSRRLQSESGAANDRLPGARAVTPREILTGSSFALTAKADGTGGGVASLWGRGAVTRFDGREGADTVSGDVTSVMLGADWTRERWTAGLMLTHSRGEGSYRGASEGGLSSAVTGLYPYGRYALNDRVTVWGVAGYGAGTLTLTPERGEPYETDMDLAMAAAGLRGVVVTAEGGPELAVTSDAMAVRTIVRGDPGCARRQRPSCGGDGRGDPSPARAGGHLAGPRGGKRDADAQARGRRAPRRRRRRDRLRDRPWRRSRLVGPGERAQGRGERPRSADPRERRLPPARPCGLAGLGSGSELREGAEPDAEPDPGGLGARRRGRAAGPHHAGGAGGERRRRRVRPAAPGAEVRLRPRGARRRLHLHTGVRCRARGRRAGVQPGLAAGARPAPRRHRLAGAAARGPAPGGRQRRPATPAQRRLPADGAVVRAGRTRGRTAAVGSNGEDAPCGELGPGDLPERLADDVDLVGRRSQGGVIRVAGRPHPGVEEAPRSPSPQANAQEECHLEHRAESLCDPNSVQCRRQFRLCSSI